MSNARVIHLPGHRLDLQRRLLQRDDGAEVTLRRQSLDLLCELARHSGEVVTKQELFDRIWPGVVVTDDSLVQAIGDVRHAIGDQRHLVIQTIPRRGYRLLLAVAETSARDDPEAVHRPDAISPHVPDRPPVAVLDFSADALASNEEQQLGRGYAEELTGELARNADLCVVPAAGTRAGPGHDLPTIAARLRVSYLVTGSVRDEGERLRVRVSLVDGRDGSIVWTERQDVPSTEVHRARDALVRRVAGTLHTSIRDHEWTRTLRKPPASLDVYTLTLRGIALMRRMARDDNAAALRLLSQVTALDPDYAPGWAFLGLTHAIDYRNAFSGPRRRETVDAAVAQCERASGLDPSLPVAHLGLTLAYGGSSRPDDAVRAGRRCLELAPSDSEGMIFLGSALIYAGCPDEALEVIGRGVEINRLRPPYVRNGEGLALWACGRVDEALAEFDEALRQAPQYTLCRQYRTLTLAEVGRVDDALADLAIVRRSIGDAVSLEIVATEPFAPRAAVLAERRRAAAGQLAAREAGTRSPRGGGGPGLRAGEHAPD